MGKGPKVPQSAIDAQAALQQQMAGLANQYASTAFPMMQSAGNYWSSLMKGGTAAQQAVAPFAEQISSGYKGAEQSIRNFAPMGGERNLALAQLPMQRSSDLARLYAGVGPAAATNLGNLAIGQGGLGANFGGVGSSAGSSLANLAGQQAAGKGGALGGLGAGLGSFMGRTKLAGKI
jgi:hypothetical protein